MDIRLKSYNHKTKLLLLLLTVVFLGTAVFQLQMMLGGNRPAECLFHKNYHKSKEFYNAYIRDALFDVSEVSYYGRILENTPYHYYISGGTKEYSDTGHNDREFYSSCDKAFFYIDNGVWKSGINSYDKLDVYNLLTGNYVVYIAFPNSFLDQKQQQWEEMRRILIPQMITFLMAAAAGVFLILWLGRMNWKEASEPDQLKRMDKANTEILLFLFLLVSWGSIHILKLILGKEVSFGLSLRSLGMNYPRTITLEDTPQALLAGGMSVLLAALQLNLLFPILRKCRAKILLRDSVLYRLGVRLIRLVKEMIHYILYHDAFSHATFTKKLYYRQLIFLSITIMNMALMVLFPLHISIWFLFPLVFELFAMLWYFKGNQWLLQHINREIKESMEEQMKSERMKVALVTNVSHDLKTPLTSIISFIDLLSKEEELSETAKDYVKILQDKSERLKHIVNDLFELAKNTSGDAAVELETLDLVKLIRQTLADMEDVITASLLQVKLLLPDTPVLIRSDGKKLYRVFQNVIDNAVKYALHGTRIIIEMKTEEERVTVWIKNIAGYEMNFTEQEILQRFFRGDQSRSTEGSGLGLSIAESFTRVCGGEFRIEIDGDMFKTAISFVPLEKGGE